MFKKILIGLVVTVVLAVVGGTIGLKALIMPRLNEIVVPQIEKAIGREVTLGKVGVKLFPYLGFEIKELEIANSSAEGFRAEPFLSLGKFQVKINTSALLKGDLAIKAIVLHNTDVLVEVNKEGHFNFADMVGGGDTTAVATDSIAPTDSLEGPAETLAEADSAAPAALPMVNLEKFEIRNLSLRYYNDQTGEAYLISDIDQIVSVAFDGETQKVTTDGELTIAGITLKSAGQSKPVKDLTLSLKHDLAVDLVAGDVTVTALSLGLQEVAITVTGAVSDYLGAPQLDLAIGTNEIPFGKLMKDFAPLSPELAKVNSRGTLALNMTVKGDATKPAVVGSAKIADGYIKYSDLPEAVEGIVLDADFTENSVNLKQLALKFGSNPISLRAAVNNFAKPSIDAAVKASVNLDDLKNSIKLPVGHSLSGRINADFSAKGTYDAANPLALAVNGSVAMEKLKVLTPDVPKELGIDGSLELSSKNIKQKITLLAGGSDLTYSGSFTNWMTLAMPDSTKKQPTPVIDLTLSSKVFNADDFMAAPEKSAATPAATPINEVAPAATASAPAAAKSILAEPLPDYRMSFTMNFGKLLYDGMTFSNFKTTLTSRDQVMKFATRCGLFGGSMRSTLTLNAKKLSDVRIAGDFALTSIQADALISTMNDKLPEGALFDHLKKLDGGITGGMTLKTDFTTRGATDADATKNLAANIHAKIHDGVLRGGTVTGAVNEKVSKFLSFDDVAYQSLKFDARIKDEQVYIDTLNITSRHTGEWGLHGKLGFDASLGLILENRLPKGISRKLTGASDKAKGKAKGLVKSKLGGTVLADFAEAELDNAGIPADKEGRVTVLLGIEGTASAPKVTLKGFKKGDGRSSASSDADLKAKAKAKADELKRKAEALARQKVEELKNKAEAEARAKADEFTKKAQAQAQKKAADLKRKAEAEAKRIAQDKAAKKAEEEAKKQADELKKKMKFKSPF